MSLTKVSYSMITGSPANILDFGANTIPGTTDMYPAFLAAYNSGASSIYIPQGNYKLSQTLKLDRAVTIYGETSAGTRDFLPANTSLITFTGTGAAFEMVGSDGNGTRNVHIRDLSIQGTAAGSSGILMGSTLSPPGYATMSSVVNVQIKGFTAVNACGLHAQYCLNSYFRNVSCFNNYDGFKTKGVNSTLTFESCWSTGNSHYGWLIDGVLSTGVFITCIAESSGIQGLYITGNTTTCSFYSWHSESNNTSSGDAPNVITTDGTSAPLYINFYGGLFGDAVGAGYRTFDLYGVAFIGWDNAAFQSYNPGFIRVDATTASCNLTTWQSNVLGTSITGNTNNQVLINHAISASTGNTGSIANATPVTIFTASSIGMYTVVARLPAGQGAPGDYMSKADVLFDGTAARIIANNATSLTITLSGNNVQVTQTSGGTQSTGVNFSTTIQSLT